jgi:hypothetical protein
MATVRTEKHGVEIAAWPDLEDDDEKAEPLAAAVDLGIADRFHALSVNSIRGVGPVPRAWASVFD